VKTNTRLFRDRIGLAAGIALFIFFQLVNPFHVEERYGWPEFFVIACVLAGVVGFAILDLRKGLKRVWTGSKYLQMPHQLVADDAGVGGQWGSTRVQTGWENVLEWKETGGTIVIKSNLGLFIVPKRQMGEAEREGFLALLGEKAIKGVGGFPVEVGSKG
jgi:hypothetical protein